MLIVVRVKERIYGIGTGSTRGCVAVEPHRKQIQNNIEYKVTEHLKKKTHRGPLYCQLRFLEQP